MIKKFYDSSEERRLKEQSHTMFEEVSSGVYFVAKDRNDKYDSFVNSDAVVRALNYSIKVAVTGNSGIYANFDLIK